VSPWFHYCGESGILPGFLALSTKVLGPRGATIVNPPQGGILGLHAIQDRPVARGGQVVIRPMMYIALTYDHRLVDGREGVTFLKRIKETIEDPARLFLEV
jgi:pyruvate/2-oxoglutarate dehydrogenase complex dihydrolipoamide acyltransferase (E2) component